MWTYKVCYTYCGHTMLIMKLNIGRKQSKQFKGEEEWWTRAQACAFRNLINTQNVQYVHTSDFLTNLLFWGSYYWLTGNLGWDKHIGSYPLHMQQTTINWNSLPSTCQSVNANLIYSKKHYNIFQSSWNSSCQASAQSKLTDMKWGIHFNA